MQESTVSHTIRVQSALLDILQVHIHMHVRTCDLDHQALGVQAVTLWSTQLSQVGMQAIHHAAIGGHVELVVSLIEQFGVDPQEKAEVTHSYSASCLQQ